VTETLQDHLTKRKLSQSFAYFVC